MTARFRVLARTVLLAHAAALWVPFVHESVLERETCSRCGTETAAGPTFRAACEDSDSCSDPSHHHHHRHDHGACAVCHSTAAIGLAPFLGPLTILGEQPPKFLRPAERATVSSETRGWHLARGPPIDLLS